MARRLPGYASFAYWLATRQPISDEHRQASVAVTERTFIELTRQLRPDLVIEAGAKDAGVSAKVRSILPGTRAVAFEANPYTYRRFAADHTPDTSGVEYRHLALSDTSGEVTFSVGINRKGKPRADGKGSLLPRVASIGDDHIEVTVPSTTLDEYFAAEPGRRSALWVDVEGAAGLVLGGADAVLRDVQFLIVEVEERQVWDGQAMRRDIIELLGSHGLVPIARDFQSRYQFNLVFVRSELRRSPEVKASLADANAV